MSVRAAGVSRPSIPESAGWLPELGQVFCATCGALASLCLLLVELTVVLSLRRAELSSVWEAQNGIVLLLPAFVALAVVGGACGGLALRLLSVAARSRPHRVMLGLFVAMAAALLSGGFAVRRVVRA